jgi:ParB-like chromosome segregation protein Spo0J
MMRALLEEYYLAEGLAEDPWKYFDKVPGTIMVAVSKLDTTRARPSGIKNAEKYMKLAYDGKGGRREPITIRKIAGGRYSVVDGNSTTAIAKKHGWKKIPATLG